MKIKRFVAQGMRQAMQQVRDEQGPEAVILSTRRLEEGIEIIAAIDYDEALVREAAAHAMPAAHADTPTPRPGASAAHDLLAQLARSATEPAPAIRDVRQELGSLREMLETQLASLAWNDMNRRQPLKAGVLRQLTRMDLDADIARDIANDLPEGLSADQARYLPLGLIAGRIHTGHRQLADVEGVMAVVGPTGVGKTTTVAKLAAHAVLHHGPQQVALISTDHYRIGASAQLGHYARLLGVPVYEVNQHDNLRSLLEFLGDRRVVLVDTAGMGAHDPRLQGQLEILGTARPHMSSILVLAANAHPQAMEDAARAYLPIDPTGCILTKLDEAPRLGGALSVLIRHRLRLDFTTHGQRVPEDIAVADPRKLVCGAASNQRPPDEEIDMATRFGHLTGATA